MDQNDGKTKDQRNSENNANTIKNAADVAIATKNPYAVAAGGAVKVADKLTGGKSTQILGKAVNSALKTSPGGRQLQKASNSLAESGLGDKVGKAASFKNSMSSGGGKQDVPDALKSQNSNNLKYGGGSNTSKANKDSGSGGLGKKDGLEKKEGLDKKDGKSKNDKASDGKSKSKDSGSILDSGLFGNAKERKLLKLKLKIILIAVGIFAGFMALFMVISYLLFVWDTFMTSITSFFGIREGSAYTSDYNEKDDEGGLWVEDKYFTNNGEDVGLTDYTYQADGKVAKGITTIIREDGECNASGTLTSWFNNLLTTTSGDFDGNVCRLLNYIWGSAEGYETKYKKYGLNIDESIIISTIFYGYDQQATYGAYEDPSSVNFVSASEHYKLLENILAGGKDALLKKEDVDRIIKSTIFEETWPYYRWQKQAKLDSNHNKNYRIQTELNDFEFETDATDDEKLKEIKDSLREEFYTISGTYSFTIDGVLEFNGLTIQGLAQRILNGETGIVILAPVLTGECVYNEHVFFYYSKEKWEMFIRFNDGGNEVINEFGVPGYVGSYGKGLGIFKPIIDRGNELFDGGYFNYDLRTLYGSGWVYDTNMNNSWINSSEQCNGTLSDSEILSQFGVDMLEKKEDGKIVSEANEFFRKRGFTSTVQNIAYTQKIPEESLYTVEEDVMKSITRKYTDNTIIDGGQAKNIEYTFDYKYGYAYIEFPGFKKANDQKLEGFIYDEVTTPKKIEVILQSIENRKEEFNEVLGADTKLKEYDAGVPLNVGSYCNQTQREGVGKFEVVVNDCQGNYMATRSFKEYILGVAYAEIGFPSATNHYEYAKTQLVAAISYTLGRASNYQHNKVFTMRSGSCDQNWCDIYLGCSRSETGGFLRADGSILLATYPGSFKEANTTKTCFGTGSTGKNYWRCPLTSEQVAKYSELFDEAYRYVVAKNTTDGFYSEGMPTDADLQSAGFNGPYVSSTQNRWAKLSEEGKTVDEILAETYPNSKVYDCVEIAGTEERSSYDWPAVNDSGNAANPNDKLCVSYNTKYDDKWNKKVIEVAYRLAGTTVGDCSTFVRKVIKISASELGIAVPGTMSTSTGMFKHYGRCNCSTVGDLKMGDIVFHRTNPARWKNVGHVAIFMGYDSSGKQMVFESNTGASKKATGSYDKPGLVVDRNTYRIAGYSRWYPTDVTESECKSSYK